jgi:K+-transporting ATPase ATPase C chain
MSRYLSISIRMMIVTAVLLGVLYPLAMTGIAQVLFPTQANGSLVKRDGRVIGSRLVAQAFSSPKYFQPRPSAAGSGYNAMDSSAANLGPTSRVLIRQVRADVRQQLAHNPGLRLGQIPVDMVTSSGSGLDPDITVANARAQAPRVAAARGMSPQRVLALVAQHTTGRQFGFLGEPRVNVLELNLALDAAQGAVASR